MGAFKKYIELGLKDGDILYGNHVKHIENGIVSLDEEVMEKEQVYPQQAAAVIDTGLTVGEHFRILNKFYVVVLTQPASGEYFALQNGLFAWLESRNGVSSVNGKVGSVQLNNEDVGAAPTVHNHDNSYYTKSQIDTTLEDYQEKLIAGQNISINADNVISAEGGVPQINKDGTMSYTQFYELEKGNYFLVNQIATAGVTLEVGMYGKFTTYADNYDKGVRYNLTAASATSGGSVDGWGSSEQEAWKTGNMMSDIGSRITNTLPSGQVIAKFGNKNIYAPPSVDHIYIATYGTTTHAQIEYAHAEGKAVFCKINDAYYPMTQFSTTEAIKFGGKTSTWQLLEAVVQPQNVWTNSMYSMVYNVNGKFGNTITLYGQNIDMDYDNPTKLDDAINAKQNTLIAGENISIENDVISATGNIYIATYGSTSFTDIKNAYNSGRVVFANYKYGHFPLVQLSSSQAIFSGMADGISFEYIICTSPKSWNHSSNSIIYSVNGQTGNTVTIDGDNILVGGRGTHKTQKVQNSVEDLYSSKQGTLTAGTGITISASNVIQSTASAFGNKAVINLDEYVSFTTTPSTSGKYFTFKEGQTGATTYSYIVDKCGVKLGEEFVARIAGLTLLLQVDGQFVHIFNSMIDFGNVYFAMNSSDSCMFKQYAVRSFTFTTSDTAINQFVQVLDVDGVVSVGEGLSKSLCQVNVDYTKVQGKLNAGTGISIGEDNTISVSFQNARGEEF